MPYNVKTDLPEAVQALPDKAAEIWRKAFNAALKEYNGDESKAAATAWAAVTKAGYEKGEDGKWSAQENHLAQAVGKLTQFARGEFSVRESDGTVTVEHGGKVWTAGCTTDGKCYAFGPWSVQEAAPAEPFSESVKEFVALSVLEAEAGADPRERTVVLIQSGDNPGKGRRYESKALETAAEKYAGMPMYLDHAGTERKPAGVRSVKDMAARILSTWVHKLESGASQVRAKVHVFDNWLHERLADEHFRSIVGLSHDADVIGRREKVGGKVWDVVESIAGVRSVDFVSRAAFGGKVLESDDTGLSRRTEELNVLETITMDDLRIARADLVTAIEDAARATFRAQESEDETVKKLQNENTELKTKVRDAAISQAVAEAVAAPDAGVPEPARAKVVAAVSASLRAQGVEGEAVKSAALEAVKATVELARAVTPAKPNVEPGDPPAPQEELNSAQKIQLLAEKLL
jgi:cation transport regulator ChaB